jgi:hypothetical protein
VLHNPSNKQHSWIDSLAALPDSAEFGPVVHTFLAVAPSVHIVGMMLFTVHILSSMSLKPLLIAQQGCVCKLAKPCFWCFMLSHQWCLQLQQLQQTIPTVLLLTLLPHTNCPRVGSDKAYFNGGDFVVFPHSGHALLPGAAVQQLEHALHYVAVSLAVLTNYPSGFC